MNINKIKIIVLTVILIGSPIFLGYIGFFISILIFGIWLRGITTCIKKTRKGIKILNPEQVDALLGSNNKKSEKLFCNQCGKRLNTKEEIELGYCNHCAMEDVGTAMIVD